jgi:hypothetical protein
VESGKVQSFEVLGKSMGKNYKLSTRRHVCGMWQLEFATNVFIWKGGLLGPSEISWDSAYSCFIANERIPRKLSA